MAFDETERDVHEAARGTRVRIGDQTLISFAGCDTLGLARDPRLVEAAQEALFRCGTGASASRTTTGTWTDHRKLELAIAEWFGAEDAVVLPSGWLAGQALAVTLAGECERVLLDESAHAALVDAARLTGLPVERYAAFDSRAARAAAERSPGPALILSDGLDPLAGSLAPVADLAAIAKTGGGHLIVDDAHAVGALGGRGLGTTEGLLGPAVHLAGSLSKALGVLGGFVPGTRALCDALRVRAPCYAGATPLPPAMAAAAETAVRIATSAVERRELLAAHAAVLAKRLRELGLPVPAAPLPWFTIGGRPARELAALSAGLRERGFLVPHVRYGASYPEGLVKVTLSAAHSPDEVHALADALDTVIGG